MSVIRESQIFLQSMLHDLDKAKIPRKAPSQDDWCSEIIYPLGNDWKVRVFYDGEYFDYISEFIDPNGKEYDVFPPVLSIFSAFRNWSPQEGCSLGGQRHRGRR